MYLFLSLAVSVGGMDGGIGSWFLFLGVVRLVDSEAKFRGGVTGALDPVPMVLWTRHPIHRAAERTRGTAGYLLATTANECDTRVPPDTRAPPDHDAPDHAGGARDTGEGTKDISIYI